MTPSLPFGDYEALANFRYTMRKFYRFSREILSTKANLTSEQYEALLALKTLSNKDGLSVGDLSERLQVKHHTAVSLTNKLVVQGLVTKKPGRADRRIVHVKLTKRGGELIESLALLHRREMRVRSPEMIEALSRLRK
jgi:DNA-binding MarR family transcriptional regulator